MAKLVAPFVWALFAVSALGSLSIWLFWVRPYIRVNGGTTSPAIFRYASFRDSREARRIAREKGQIPWFLTWLRILTVVGIALALLWFLAFRAKL